jgi:hypothetical protein
MAWFSRRKSVPAPDSPPASGDATPLSELPDLQESWVVPPFDSYPLSQGNVLVVSEPDRKPRRLEAALAETARTLKGCHPWPTHRAKLLENSGFEDFSPDGGAGDLEALVEAGLLRPASAIKQQLGEGQAATPNVALKTVCIFSCNRPSAVCTAWESLHQHLLRYGRAETDVIVVHDSSSERLEEVLQSLGASPASSSGGRLRHFLPEGRQRMADYLVSATGEHRELVEWGLGLRDNANVGPGGPVNAMLLLGAGKPLLFTDDDMVFDFRRLPESDGSLRLAAINGADHYRFSPEPWAPFEGDYLAEHERWLGRPARELLRAGVPLGSMEGLEAPLLRRLDHNGARVALTSAGYAGDPGFGGPIAYLTMPPKDAPGFWQNADIYQAALRERCHLRVAPCPTITAGHTVLSGAMALDNRTLLPACIPNHRVQDAAFVSHLLASDVGALLAALPVAVGHHPEGPPRAFDHAWTKPWPLGRGFVRYFENLVWLWRDFGSQARGFDVRSRLFSIAHQWESAGTRDPAAHLRHLRILGLKELEGRGASVEKRLGQAQHPAHRLDLESLLQRINEQGRDEWFFLPGGASRAPGFVEEQQAFCRRYGAFLKIWPSLWDAALQLPAEERMERFAPL